MSDRERELALLIAGIEKDYGAGTVVGAAAARNKDDVISTGSLSLDIATGIGGFARGSIVELFGWESSGKSTISLNVIANTQKKGLKALLVDAENSFDAKYAEALGINVEDLFIIQMDAEGAEKSYNAAERLIKSGHFGTVVFDSQTALLPKKIVTGEAGDNNLGLHARLMSQMVPKIMTSCGEANCLGIFISQLREKIGVMFGSPETTNGGHALKFYAHMRVRVSKTVQKEGDEAVSNKTKCKIVKNKLAAPFKEAEFDVLFGEGVDRMKEIITIGADLGIIAKSGSWYSCENNSLGQGSDKVKELLRDNPELTKEIEEKIILRIAE